MCFLFACGNFSIFKNATKQERATVLNIVHNSYTNKDNTAGAFGACLKCGNVAASMSKAVGFRLTSLFLLVIGQFLDGAALAEAPDWTGQPFSQSVSRAFGTGRAGLQGAEGWLRLQVRHRLRLPIRAADGIVFWNIRQSFMVNYESFSEELSWWCH